MACELLDCCQFFKDNMKGLPTAAEHIRNRICLGSYESCVRYRIYRSFGRDELPEDLHPSDLDEVEKVMRCLRSKNRSAA